MRIFTYAVDQGRMIRKVTSSALPSADLESSNGRKGCQDSFMKGSHLALCVSYPCQQLYDALSISICCGADCHRRQ
jgi:hypothetical protein